MVELPGAVRERPRVGTGQGARLLGTVPLRPSPRRPPWPTRLWPP